MKSFPKFKRQKTHAWEQRKLGECGNTFTGLSGKSKFDFGHGSARYITYVNVLNNPIADKNIVGLVEIDDKQNQVKYGDCFFTTSSETPEEVGMSSVWLENTSNFYLNSFCFGYRPTTSFNPYYLAFMLRSDGFRKKVTFLAQGISRFNISKTKVMDLEIFIPSLKEQTAIGNFFRQLDAAIASHQRKLERVKELKKSLLQKMFPKDGEAFPELRFPNFTDAWEQRKLGECVKFKITNSFSRENLNYENGKVRNIHYGDIHTKFQALFDIAKEKVPFINSAMNIDKISEDFYCKEGDLVFADASEDLKDVGKSIEIINLNNEKVLSGLHTLLARPSEKKFSKGFNGYLFQSSNVRLQIQKQAQGSKILTISF